MESFNSLLAISPIDGRYRKKTENLSQYFSEFALIRYRVYVEVEYFIALCHIPLPALQTVETGKIAALRRIYKNFCEKDALEIKTTEKTINHDVKAVEYFVKGKMKALGMEQYTEFVHFGLTSQDINNTAFPIALKHSVKEVYIPAIEHIIEVLSNFAEKWADVPMLAHTHGQPASPSLLGKEIAVYQVRLQEQLATLKQIPFAGKFGGATGNLNAHYLAYPEIDWQKFADNLLSRRFGLKRSWPTTQIEHYDHIAALFHAMCRINTILIDLCRDFWTYISMEYFHQRINSNEVGSSAMPHKVNPIDFENAEGNLGIANAIFLHIAGKLPISRLQRDLTDSTVIRNIGVPIAHTSIAFKSLLTGLDKVILNPEALDADLEANWAVLAEAIQTLLRREGFPKPYEALKALTRTNRHITKESLHNFINELPVSDSLKQEMLALTPSTYTGYHK